MNVKALLPLVAVYLAVCHAAEYAEHTGDSGNELEETSGGGEERLDQYTEDEDSALQQARYAQSMHAVNTSKEFLMRYGEGAAAWLQSSFKGSPEEIRFGWNGASMRVRQMVNESFQRIRQALAACQSQHHTQGLGIRDRAKDIQDPELAVALSEVVELQQDLLRLAIAVDTRAIDILSSCENLDESFASEIRRLKESVKSYNGPFQTGEEIKTILQAKAFTQHAEFSAKRRLGSVDEQQLDEEQLYKEQPDKEQKRVEQQKFRMIKSGKDLVQQLAKELVETAEGLSSAYQMKFERGTSEEAMERLRRHQRGLLHAFLEREPQIRSEANPALEEIRQALAIELEYSENLSSALREVRANHRNIHLIRVSLDALKSSLKSLAAAYSEADKAFKLASADRFESGARFATELAEMQQQLEGEHTQLFKATPKFLLSEEEKALLPKIVRGTWVPLGYGAYHLRKIEEDRKKAEQDEKRAAKRRPSRNGTEEDC